MKGEVSRGGLEKQKWGVLHKCWSTSSHWDPSPAAQRPLLCGTSKSAAKQGAKAVRRIVINLFCLHSQARCRRKRWAVRSRLWHPGPGNTEQPQIGYHSPHQSHRVTFSDSKEPRTVEPSLPCTWQAGSPATCCPTADFPAAARWALSCNC